jgi:carboxymethylenebutenolidase
MPAAPRFLCVAPPRLARTGNLPQDQAAREDARMALHIDYYASLNSPWTHLGAARIEAMAMANGASLRIYPVDFGTIFPASGGLPLPKRAPQRQAYRMMELRRWREFLGIPITLEPKHFPSNELPAACCVIAVRETIGDQPAVRLAHRVLKAVWQEERDPGDPATLAALIRDVGLDPESVMKLGADPQWAERRNADTRAALERGVFGAPSYVIDNEIFWGQDRLDFVQRRLARG